MDKVLTRVYSNNKKTLLFVGGLLAVGLAAWGTYEIIKSQRKKKNQEEIDRLLEIAEREGILTKSEVDKYRNLLRIKQLSLPKAYQVAYDKIKPFISEMGSAGKGGYWDKFNKAYASLNSNLPSNGTMRSKFVNAIDLLKKGINSGAFLDDTNGKLKANAERVNFWWGSLSDWGFAQSINDYLSSSEVNNLKEFNSEIMSENDYVVLKLIDLGSADLMGKSYFDMAQENIV